MRLKKIPLFILALTTTVCGSATAGLVDGTRANVDASITVVGENSTTGNWTPAKSFSSNSGLKEGELIGTLGVTAKGEHNNLQVSGVDAVMNGNTSVIKFTNASDNSFIEGRIHGDYSKRDSGIEGKPGWSVPNTSNGSYTLQFKAHGNKETLTPGEYKTQIYVQQWVN